ncbi:hypothetical protein [Sphingosinicella sp.]|uniref:hypothetical protein n=1 Tax=Sphingosinicella sp. TaxID=1917971 RepID=UPI0025EAA01A|nr:hypothetical protein [Sphingosinicella sp.]
MTSATTQHHEDTMNDHQKTTARTCLAAGCAGYIVSFSGRRALYIGRTAEIHVEPFPGQ